MKAMKVSTRNNLSAEVKKIAACLPANPSDNMRVLCNRVLATQQTCLELHVAEDAFGREIAWMVIHRDPELYVCQVLLFVGNPSIGGFLRAKAYLQLREKLLHRMMVYSSYNFTFVATPEMHVAIQSVLPQFRSKSTLLCNYFHIDQLAIDGWLYWIHSERRETT